MSKERKILLIEDGEDHRKLMQTILTPRNFTVECAEDGLKGIAKFKAEAYHLVLMDLELPKASGFSATKTMRRWEREQHKEPTPIIAISAYSEPEMIDAAIKAGCNQFFNKAGDRRKLLDDIETLIATAPEQPAPTTPAPSSTRPQRLDHSILDSVRALLDPEDQGFVQDQINLFTKQSSSLFQNMNEAFQKHDYLELKRMAHKIAGSAAWLGGLLLQDICFKLEQACLEGLPERINLLLEDARSEYRALAIALAAAAQPKAS